MDEMLAGADHQPDVDPQGSLIDADMAAYYTWINLRRLSGADRAAFVVWFEKHKEAFAIGPGMPRGAEGNAQIGMPQLLNELL